MNKNQENHWRRVRRLFRDCVEAGTAEEMKRALGTEPDAHVRREVATLLSLRQESGLAVDHPWSRILQPEGGVTAGATLRGRYRLRRFLAAGGMGEVFEAVDGETGARVAVKLVRVFAEDAEEQSRLRSAFEREARLAGRIDHPNVCRIRAVDLEHDPPYCVMDFLDGRTLAEHLAEAGPMLPGRAFSLVFDICAGLEAAHARGIVHRDLKPGNVMLTDEGRAVIIDFGLAMAAGWEAPGSLVGTPAYLAPEVRAGGGATPAADLYSLGVLMAELLGPRRPDGVWRAVIEACLEADPARRPESAREVVARLAAPPERTPPF